MFAAIIFVRREIFEIRTLNYLETLVIPHVHLNNYSK